MATDVVKQISEFTGINSVILIASFEKCIFARITGHYSRHMRLQQGIKPCGTSTFFECYPQGTSKAVDELQNGRCFCFDYRIHHHLPGRIHDRYRDGCLMDIHSNILISVHKGAPFDWLSSTLKAYIEGALFYNALREKDEP